MTDTGYPASLFHPRNDGNQNGKRLGLETPAWYRLARG